MKHARSYLVATLLLAAPLLAHGAEPIANWTAPPYWTPPSARELEDRAFGREPLAIDTLAVEALPSAAMPFVAITPCRLADTRGNGFIGSYGPPALTAGGSRTMTVTGQCGIPSGALAVSFNVTVTNTLGAGFILAYPAGGSAPSVSTLNYVAGQTLANAAIVPLSDTGGATFVAGVSGTDLILDVNGYYAPASIVNSVNGLTGNLALSQGTNVTITPSGSTLTIASTPGTHTHAAGDITSGYLADGRLAGTYSGILTLPNLSNNLAGATLTANTTLALGSGAVTTLGGSLFLHSGGNVNNTFLGRLSGNASVTGMNDTAVGVQSLAALTSGSSNTAVGAYALNAVTTAAENTAVGALALGANTAGANTAVGKSALASNTTGIRNVAVGWQAAYGSTTASDNTAVGYNALGPSTGTANTAVGAEALDANTSGVSNVAIGSDALGANTTGSENTAVGTNAMKTANGGSGNSAFGAGAMENGMGGSQNSAFGWHAMRAVTSASQCTAFGYEALASNTSGLNNNAVGYQALRSNTTGYSNNAFGWGSLTANTTGWANIAYGGGTLYSSQTGAQNTAVGWNALSSAVMADECVAVGRQALSDSTESFNTAVGAGALSNLGSGVNNVALGYNAGNSCSSGTNNIYIGNVGTSESNTTRIGNGQTSVYLAGIFGQTATSGTAVYINSAGKLGTSTSSRRYKRDIADLGEASAVLMQLRPVSFRYSGDRDPSGERQYGLIAEEVAEVAPELVVFGPDGQPETVKYHLVNALALAGLQEARRTNDAQERRIEELTNALERMARRLAALEALAD